MQYWMFYVSIYGYVRVLLCIVLFNLKTTQKSKLLYFDKHITITRTPGHIAQYHDITRKTKSTDKLVKYYIANIKIMEYNIIVTFSHRTIKHMYQLYCES